MCWAHGSEDVVRDGSGSAWVGPIGKTGSERVSQHSWQVGKRKGSPDGGTVCEKAGGI